MAGFNKGDTIKLRNGDVVVFDKKFGNGGTADVYRVLNATKKKYQCAKHLYGGRYASEPEKYYEKCNVLYYKWHSPHPAFVWCEDKGISDYDKKTKSFVYVMELLENYDGVKTIIRDPEILKIKDRIEICRTLAEAAKAAVDQNLIFGDWSANNVMWKREKNGNISIRIIDTDPTSIPGAPLGMGGTGKYRAPEVMLGEPQSQQSDIYSLTVLTFRLFCGRHPLDGKRTRSEPETEETIMKYYAKEPIFIFDGDVNAPSRLVATRFYSLPMPLQKYYSYIFSNGSLHGRIDRMGYDDFLKILDLSLKSL